MERIVYYDYLRFFSILAIIIIHVAGLFSFQEVVNVNIMAFYNSISAFAVPVFLMLSGALLLNRDYSSISSFLKKRFSRILKPYFFWIIFTILSIIVVLKITTFDVGTISFLVNNIFNYSIAWYVWLILGAYLAIPLVNILIKNCTFKEIEYFLVLFIFATVFYKCLVIFGITVYFDLTFFIGPVSYLILGYYLANKDFKLSSRKIIVLTFIVYLAMVIIKTKLFFTPLNQFIYLNPNFGLSSSLDFGILTLISASSVFLFFRYLLESKKAVNKFVFSISKSSYGIYLVQVALVTLIQLLSNIPLFTVGEHVGLKVAIAVPILSILILLISWILVLLVSKIPFLKNYSGYY